MQIILYDASWQLNEKGPNMVFVPDEIAKKPNKSLIKPRGFGIGLIIGSIVLFLVLSLPSIKEEIVFRFLAKREAPKVEAYGQMFETSNEQKRTLVEDEAKKYGVDTNFSLVIPKINTASNIIPNVDPTNEEIYKDLLGQAVGHAKGSKFPGSKGTIYLFSHSTNDSLNILKYNAVFYLLKDLSPGDTIIIFYAGNKYEYIVEKKVIVEADDFSEINNTIGEEKLILQTCWPPGTTLKRLLVIARPI